VIDWDGERELLRKDLAKLIDYLELNDWVSFRDGVFYGDMPGLYNEADIVINPSRGEPLGLVPLEAMAASRPVVVTASGGMLETITRMTGALVADDEKIVDNLFEAVRGFLDNPKEAVKAGRRGQKHVAKAFHMKKYVREMIHEYRTTPYAPTVVQGATAAPAAVRLREANAVSADA
jgi:glycosyltransferase involved in cell wall biosynthesis